METDISSTHQEHVVLVNAKGQYSLWIASKAAPLGWTLTAMRGARTACMEYIDRVWRIDNRPGDAG
jgi:MbtH protein